MYDTHRLLTPKIALTPINLVFCLLCPTKNTTSNKCPFWETFDSELIKNLVKSLARVS